MAINLDVAAPEDVARVLRTAAEKYRESQSELESAWQDKGAGRAWGEIARALDHAADSCEKSTAKYL